MKIEASKKKSNVGGQPGNNNAQKWTEEKAVQLANELIDWLSPRIVTRKGKKVDMHAGNIFMISFLAKMKLGKDLPAYLSERYKSFAELLNIAKTIQEAKILQDSFTFNAHATIAKFVLINHHGYNERVELSGNVGNRPDFDYSKLSDDELAQMEAILKKAEVGKGQ